MFHSILIGTNEIAKISDFGTCRHYNEQSTKMSFAGTVAWMAPEIIRNEPCNERVDTWYVYLIYYHFAGLQRGTRTRLLMLNRSLYI